MKNHKLKALSLFVICFAAYVTGYLLLRVCVPIRALIPIMNGLFAGSLASVAVAYGPLFIHAITGRKPYDSVRQMTVGFTLLWASMGIAVLDAIYVNAIGLYYPTTELALFARYSAIIAAAIQIYAPDFGLGLFHGRDRRVFVTAIGIGLAVAGVMIMMQSATPL